MLIIIWECLCRNVLDSPPSLYHYISLKANIFLYIFAQNKYKNYKSNWKFDLAKLQ